MKRQYKIQVMSGMEYMTTSRWGAIRAHIIFRGMDVLFVLLKILLTPTFWIIVAIIAAAFIMRGC